MIINLYSKDKIVRIVDTDSLIETNFLYDEFGNKTNETIFSVETNSLLGDISYEYNSEKQLVHVIDKVSHDDKLYEEWYEYDSNGNEIIYRNSGGLSVFKKYDKFNNLILETDIFGYEKVYEYDVNNNVIHSKETSGLEIWYKYNADNLCIYEERNSGSFVIYEYDDANNIVSIKFKNCELEMKYDSNGNEVLCTGTDGIKISKYYNSDGKLVFKKSNRASSVYNIYL
jgi:YD repeat-containing protein